MSRIRSIHPGFFTDEDIVHLSVKARLLILALGTYSDYADRFVFDEHALREFCGDIVDSFDELIKAGLIHKIGQHYEIEFAFGFRRKRVSKWENLRSLVFIRDSHTCQYCGSKGGKLHCDHVVPVSRGGTNTLDNLTTSCQHCNLSKGSKTLEEWHQ
jgi:hypothetical protein